MGGGNSPKSADFFSPSDRLSRTFFNCINSRERRYNDSSLWQRKRRATRPTRLSGRRVVAGRSVGRSTMMISALPFLRPSLRPSSLPILSFSTPTLVKGLKAGRKEGRLTISSASLKRDYGCRRGQRERERERENESLCAKFNQVSPSHSPFFTSLSLTLACF